MVGSFPLITMTAVLPLLPHFNLSRQSSFFVTPNWWQQQVVRQAVSWFSVEIVVLVLFGKLAQISQHVSVVLSLILCLMVIQPDILCKSLTFVWTQDQRQQQPSTSAADAAASHLSSLSLDTGNLRMTHTSRAKLRESIGGSLKALREKQQMQEIMDSDPLLGG